MRYRELLLENIKDKLRKLYPLENQDILLQFFFKKWIKRLVVVLSGTILIAVVLMITSQEKSFLQEGNVLNRPEYAEEELEVNLKAKIGAEGAETENLTLQIAPEKYTRKEFERVVEEAIPELEKAILGNNPATDEITEDMILPEMLLGTPIEISWESDNEEVLTRTGKVNLDIVNQEDSIISLTAVFRYEEYKISHTIGLKVKHRELSEQERLKRLLLTEIQKAFDASKEEKKIELPVKIEGNTIIYEEEKQQKNGSILFFVMAGILVWAIAIKEELESMEKKREKQLLMDYPALISQFTLLLGAGMTISGAWQRLIMQYEKQQKSTKTKKRRYVYEEMTITWREMKNGVSEVEAIGRFGARIKLVPYLKFSTLLSQNIRKGSRGLIELLKVEGKLAYEDRKEMAKQLGEEAGTRLLIPMFMMFGIVLVVILVPAFSSF